MHVQVLSWEEPGGWSGPLPADLDSASTLVLAFGSPPVEVAADLLDEVAKAFPTARLAGCSTAGEIVGERVGEGGLGLAVARFDHTRLRVATAPIASPEGSRAAGLALAEELSEPDLRAILVLSDGLRLNGTALLRAMNEQLSPEVVVTGGLAGDGDRFSSTWVVADTGPVSGQVTAVGLYGDRVSVGHGSQGGWDPFGVERVVTRSSGTVLYELDGEPALELYRTYLGDRAAGLPATALLFPLALRTSVGDSVVRTVLSVDDDEQSMRFAGDIPQGATVQLMRANFDRLVEGAHQAGRLARRDQDPGRPCLAVAISCVGRRLVLGERTEEEVDAVLEGLPQGAELIGFYSYGEISPSASGQCDLHNQTMTLTTIVET
jgi:hypothetical protein